MKKIILTLFVVLVGFAVISCSDDKPVETDETELLTDEEFFNLYCIGEDCVWERTSGGLTFNHPGYAKIFSSTGSATEFYITEGTSHKMYFSDGTSTSNNIVVTPNSDFLTGTIASVDSDSITYVISKTAKTMVVTKGSETVTFTLEEE